VKEKLSTISVQPEAIDPGFFICAPNVSLQVLTAICVFAGLNTVKTPRKYLRSG
jgi:hypothetical protein